MRFLVAGQGVASIGCILTRLYPAGQELFRAVERDVVEERDVAGMEAAREKMTAAADRCSAEHHWSNAATNAAVDFTFATVALPVIEDAMRADGNDPQRAERAFQSLTAEQRAGFKHDGGDVRPALEALNGALAAQGISLKTDRQLHEIGLFASTMSVLDQARTAFPAL